MSTRSNTAPGRTIKPALASSRVVDRSPLTPRLALSSQSTPTLAARRPIATPRIKSTQDGGDTDSGGNVTPRSAKRRSRVEGSNSNTPTQLDSPDLRTSNTISPLVLSNEQLSVGSTLSRPAVMRSPLSDTVVMRAHAPLVRTSSEAPHSSDGVDSRFFHASDISKVESEKKLEPKRPAAFFYADGKQEPQSKSSTRTTSPIRSEQRSSSGWIRPMSEGPELNQPVRSPPMLSPALSAISSSSPFFNIAVARPRSPSPSKENIHLSYRKGASQIFGSRPSPIPTARAMPEIAERRPSLQRAINSHRKSPSLSSIESGLSQRSRRRSVTVQDMQGSSPLRTEPAIIEPTSPTRLPLIETTLEQPVDSAPMSPTKAISDLAADARRERKVLDLEISNSSLLAINASLEREIRRQKTELKRFRRLSRAGRFSFNPMEERRGSGSLDALIEDNDDHSEFGPASNLSELYDDMSDSDEESSLASGELEDGKNDRLAKDERRLRADLDKHKELLVQSQMMNQSLRRCMYATEEMIKEGKKAIDYKIRVSDVKLGGRILTGLEDEDDGHAEEIEVEDEELDNLSLASPATQSGVDDHAHTFVELWGGIGKADPSRGASRNSLSEGGDRDSGIEVDRPVQLGVEPLVA